MIHHLYAIFLLALVLVAWLVILYGLIRDWRDARQDKTSEPSVTAVGESDPMAMLREASARLRATCKDIADDLEARHTADRGRPN